MRNCPVIPILSVLLSIAVCAESIGAGPQEKGPLTGRWKAIFERDGEDRDYYFQLVQNGDRISGDFISPRSGKYPIKSGSVKGDDLKIAVLRRYSGIQAEFKIEGKLEGKRKMTGGVTALGNDVAAVFMTRLPDPVGTWKVKSYSADGEKASAADLNVVRTPKGLKGTFTRDRGVIEAKSVEWTADSLVIAIAVRRGGRDLSYSVEATFKDANSLTGRWKRSESGGKWTAERKTKVPVYELAGRWKAVSKSGEQSSVSVLEIVANGQRYRGLYKGKRGETAYRRVSLEGDEVRLELVVEVEGEPVTFLVQASFKDKDNLQGRWQVKDFADYAGEWTATRDVRGAASVKKKN